MNLQNFRKSHWTLTVFFITSIVILTSSCGVLGDNACDNARDTHEEAIKKVETLKKEATKGYIDYLLEIDRYKVAKAQDPNNPKYQGPLFQSSPEVFYQDNYAQNINRESNIRDHVVVNSPQCFDARTVAEAQLKISEGN